MLKIISGTAIVAGLTFGALAAVNPVSAAEVVGVQVGGIGLGFKVGNGHYYDNNHHRQSYTYPADWKTYHHPQSWYRNHPQWNDQHGNDWYRR